MGLVNSCDPEVLALNVKTHMLCYLLVQNLMNYIGGVMVSMLTSSTVDLGCEPQMGQTKD